MMRPRLARRLGLDGNPLRRRTDKIAVSLAALLLAVFLIGAPLLSMAAIGWAGRAAAAALVVTVALGIALLSLAWAGRWLLDRHRLAVGETFQSRG